MRSWVDLYGQHQTVRRPDKSWTSEIRRRLTKLAEHGHCDASARSRFTNKSADQIQCWSFRRDQQDKPEPLLGLDTLKSAELTVLAKCNKSGHIHQFTVGIDGVRNDDTPFILHVHLSDDGTSDSKTAGDKNGLGARCICKPCSFAGST